MRITANNRYQCKTHPFGFRPVDVNNADELRRVVSISDYSPSVFSPLTMDSPVWAENEKRKGTDKYRNLAPHVGKPYRCNDHWVSSDFYAIDVDKGMSIQDFQGHPDFQDVAYIIITSRSHQKAKGAEPPCDRYHVLFPAQTITDRVRYEQGMLGIVAVYNFADDNAKDAARFFFASNDTKVIWHDGVEFIPPSPPEKFEDDIPDWAPEVKPRKDYKWNGIPDSTKSPDKKELVLDGLIKAAASGAFSGYQEYINIGIAMKEEGYGEADWHEVLCAGKPADSETLRQYEYKWNTFQPDGRRTGGTLVYYARMAVPDLLKATIKPSLSFGSPSITHAQQIDPAPDSEARQPKIRHISAMTAKAPDWLIDGYIEKQGYALVFGESGHYKSFVSLDWAFCVAAGLEWCGWPVKQGTVLYMFGEGGSGLRRRFEALAIKYGIAVDSLPIYYDNDPPAIIDPVQVIGRINDIVADMPEPPVLIVIDTLNTAFGAGNENSTEAMTAFNHGNHQFINRLGSTVLLVHHSGLASSDRSRGNSALRARLDHEYQCVKDEESKTMVMTNRKMKDAEPPEPITFEFRQVELGHENMVPITSGVLHMVENGHAEEMVHRLTDTQQKILEVVEKAPNGVGVIGVASSVYGMNHTQKQDLAIKQTLKRMVAAGLIDRIRNGLYGPVDNQK
jgi:hypothetical protein